MIGSATARKLRLAGFDVQCILHELDAPDRQTELVSLLNGCRVLVHVAGYGHPASPSADHRAVLDANVMFTSELLTAARAANVQRVVFASSASVYGASADTAEPSPVDLRSHYAVSKYAGEHLCRLFGSDGDRSAVVLRLFNVFGDLDRGRDFVSACARKILTSEPIRLTGDGKQSRDFIHVDDVADAFVESVTLSTRGCSTFNIGTGVGTELVAVVETIEQLTERKATVCLDPAAPGGVRRSVADLRQTKRAFEGFRPASLPVGIGRMLATAGAR